MAFEEKISIEEELIAHIIHADGTKEDVVVKTPHKDKNFIYNVLKFFGLKHEPGTFLDAGLNDLAGLLGGVSGYYAINRIGSSISGGAVSWVASESSITGTGSIRISNSLNPWTGGNNYVNVLTANSINLANIYGSIAVAMNFTSASSLSWWAEITYRFANG